MTPIFGKRGGRFALFLLLWALGLGGNAYGATDTFTASGIWVAPAGVTAVTVEAWGGGGAGGGNPTNADGGGGGGGGAYSSSTVAVIPGNAYTVTVGAGGIAVSGAAGGAGGDSWFSTAGTLLAKGGGGGNPPVAGAGGIRGAGGSAAAGIGTTKFSGGDGGTGRNSNTGRGAPGGSSAGTAAVGTSGPVVWSTATAGAPPAGGGIGGNGGNADAQNGFAPATGSGGGGGGGAEQNTAGGNGAGGKVTITTATVTSINCVGACTTNTASVSWLVTFDTSITGGGSGNFSLVVSGLGGTPAITSVVGSGTTRTVTASTGTGSGTLGLDMVNATGVSPSVTGLPFAGQAFTLDRTPPAVSSIARANPSPTDLASVSWTVTFSKSVTGVDTADFVLAQAGGVSGATITGVTPVSGTVYTVTATTGAGNGTLGLNLADDDSILDAAGNPLGGAGAGNGNFTGAVYVVNKPLSITASPTACVDDANIGTQVWGTLTGPFASDNSYASASVDDNQTTHFLKCTGYGFAIPAGATILGITVNVERKSSASLTQDAAMRVVKGGIIGTTDRSTATAYTTADVVEAHGGTADLWGTTWTVADINASDFGAAFAAQKAGTAGGARTVTVDHLAITVSYAPPVPVASPDGFNAFESGTTPNPGAIAGPLYTKLVGAGFSVDVVAVLSGAQHALTDTVQVDLVSGATGCGALSAIDGISQSVNLTNGRGTTGSFSIATAHRQARVRVRYPVSSPTVTSCSTDYFAIRPTGFTVTSTNATQTGTSGTPAIKTGALFNLTATAVAGYNGTPLVNNDIGWVLGTPTQGAIGGAFAAAPIGTGIATGDFTYSEVGHFGLAANAVYDASFVADSSDAASGHCVAGSFSNALSGGQYGCSIGSTAVPQTTGASGFGRFIPDNFGVALTTPPIFGSTCGTFTYVGQAFTFPTAVMTVTARNGAALGNATTQNYAGSYVKLTNTTITPNTQDARYTRFDALGGGATPALVYTGLPATAGDPAIGAFASGVATLTFSPGSGLSFSRGATPSAPFNADIVLAVNVIDSDGVAFAGNPASFGTASAGNGIAFSGGKPMRFGRLRLQNASGSQMVPLLAQAEAQYWSGAAFITNTADSCTAIAPGNIAMGPYAGSLTDSPTCRTAVSGGGTLSAGRGTFVLAAPGAVNSGSVTLTANLGAAPAGVTCAAIGVAPVAATTANVPHLQGNWAGGTYNQNPSSRATFGTRRGSDEVIHIRENLQ